MATTIKLFAIVLVADALTTPASAFDVRPNPGITGGSLRIDGHDLTATCGHAKVHRGSMSHALRDEILTRYGLLPGAHPDYEIDHLIPLCLGGSDDPSNLWAQPRRSIEPKWNADDHKYYEAHRPSRRPGLYQQEQDGPHNGKRLYRATSQGSAGGRSY